MIVLLEPAARTIKRLRAKPRIPLASWLPGKTSPCLTTG
jgi:hypothetical protein